MGFRWSCRVVLVPVCLLLACSGPSKEIKHKPPPPTEMTFRSRTPAVGHYASHAVTVKVTGFEGRVL